MSIYKFSKGSRSLMYFKDGKLISKNSIPENVFQSLVENEEFDDNGLKPDVLHKECIFCNKYAGFSRLVNLQMVDLCEHHYYDTNVGQIAQRLQEKFAP